MEFSPCIWNRFSVYSHSYFKYGQDQALIRLLDHFSKIQLGRSLQDGDSISSVCHLLGFNRSIGLADGKHINVIGTANTSECYEASVR